VRGGELVHAAGFGERYAGGPVPDDGTVFRIASMTKSFTAAAVLALRDDGALALDDPAAGYVPQLRGLRLPTADSPRPSLRHLLTMTAGFPTDDPWGDRQQGLPLAEFADLLAGGVSFGWAPGTRFEYSNLGYALLGRVISAVTGAEYPEFVRDRLLTPLGLAQTGFDASEFDPERLARGYRHTDDGWSELAPDPCGAFAPMGGIFSCVRDLTRWVSGFAGAFPAGEPGGGPHPLPRATRREMQLPQVALVPPPFTPLPGEAGWAAAASYGFGLFVEESPAWGRVVQHSGGYPGFGSHMCWHPATGLGVVVLANSTYAAAHTLGERMLDAVLRHAGPGGGREPALAPAGPWPETLAAQREVSRLLRAWDDAHADRLFSENVAMDSPYPERRKKIDLVRQRIGEFADDPGRPPESDTPAHRRWWLRGERGVVQASIQLTPESPPRVMSVTLAVPPAQDSPLARALAGLVSLLNDGAPGWPSSLAAAASLDTGLLVRQFRMAAAWAGRCVPGAFRGGDGETEVTLDLGGEHATLTPALAITPPGNELRKAEILLTPDVPKA